MEEFVLAEGMGGSKGDGEDEEGNGKSPRFARAAGLKTAAT